MAFEFYNRHASAFAREFGLMQGAIDRLKLEGDERDVFEAKLGAAHAMYGEMRERDAKKGGG